MNQYSLLPVDEMPLSLAKVTEKYKPKQDFRNLYVNLQWVFRTTDLHKSNVSSLAVKKSTLLDKAMPFCYLPVSSIDLVHNFSNNDLLIHSILKFFVLGVLADLQVSPLKRLPNTTEQKTQEKQS